MFKFQIAWSITTLCNNKCKHCFMYDDSTFKEEQKNILSLKALFKVLDDIESFEKKYNIQVYEYAITGGDPLLRKDWPDFLSELSRRKKRVKLLPNPEKLSEDVLKKLKSLNIEDIQLSLDGLELVHDKFRRKNSFKTTINKLELLKHYGFRTTVRFTLYPFNANQLIPLIRFLSKKDIDIFTIGLGCSVGNAKQLDNFDKKSLYEILKQFLDEKERIKKKNCKIRFNHDIHFLKLILFEQKKYFPMVSSDFHLGCSLGFSFPNIASDGSLYACRLMPKPVGKLPEQSFEEVYLGNLEMKKYRRALYYEKCGTCELYYDCRGCPAQTFGIKNNAFSSNPLCFKDMLKRKVSYDLEIEEPSLNTTYDEEWNFIRSKQNVLGNFWDVIEEKDFQTCFMIIYENSKSRNEFISDPFLFLKKRKILLSKKLISWLIFTFNDSESNKGKSRSEMVANQIQFNLIDKKFDIKF